MHFDILIVVTPADCERVLPLYPRLVDNFDYGNICFIGSEKVGELAAASAVADRTGWVDENDVVPFDEVHACMAKRLEPVLNGEPLPRGITGWYYQQFLKMQYAFICKDEYYMAWDGDTIPCRKINMFSAETGQPYLDLKHEHHPIYFETMGKILPGFRKVIERSFISEHMLFKADIMKSLIADIEKNENIPGEKFWEKIINAIEPEKIYDSAFSEFETYGTYVALKFPNVYKLREWHSFRLGASFFDMNTISERDFAWLGVDFDAISFEKGQSVAEGNGGFFDNPEVQQKISAKKLLQAAQMEYKDGYKEIWEDDIQAGQSANVVSGGYNAGSDKDNTMVIVVVSQGDQAALKRCVDSIKENMDVRNHMLVVEDATASDLGYAALCNKAVRSSIGTPFEKSNVMLLSDHAEIFFDSLYYLKEALYMSKDIGATGSISNCADNNQQVAAEFKTHDDLVKLAVGINVPMPAPCIERTVLSDFAILIRRSVWDEIGGFDEDFSPGGYEMRALSMDILRKGYRLMLVRNSFVYQQDSSSFRGEISDETQKAHRELFCQKYGFDIDRYISGASEMIAQIPFDAGVIFRVLHVGCGIGTIMKAVRSIYPKCEVVGVEPDAALCRVAGATERVLESLYELLDYYDGPSFEVVIISKEILDALSEEEKGVLGSLCYEDSVLIVDESVAQ